MHASFRNCLLLSLALPACGGPDAAQEKAAAPPAAAPTGVGAAPGMQGMGGMQGGGMMEEMQTHMRSMQGAGGDSLRAMLPMHRQMAANMIARMNREMRDMNMAAGAGWTATVDSLRQDLVRMPEMDAEELHAFMLAHEGRLNRLMEMHREMMRQ
ncbi:MAG TPA: hypothetical protein VFR37_15360 [Longimicrobium sp.]|nr:hypothetical protein [Longimicrobium sp.]